MLSIKILSRGSAMGDFNTRKKMYPKIKIGGQFQFLYKLGNLDFENPKF